MFYRHVTGMTYTEGVKNMAEENNAYWLIDAISSHIIFNPRFKARCAKDERYADMQIWILETNDNKARLFSVADTTQEELNKPTCLQKIEYTDFPHPSIKFYCARNFINGKETYTIMKPSEY